MECGGKAIAATPLWSTGVIFPESARGLAQSKTWRKYRSPPTVAPASWTAVALYRFSAALCREATASRAMRACGFELVLLIIPVIGKGVASDLPPHSTEKS